MRKIIILLAVVAASAVFAAQAWAAPKMALSADSWDFGEIYQWTNPSTRIEINNTGDTPLKITDVKVSCGCTATMLSSDVIEPGGTGSIKIDFASYLMTGKVSKTVRLTTNDPAAKVKDINIKGVIKEDKGALGILDKDYVDLGVVAPYETRSLEAVISNRGNIDLNITGIELPKGWFMDSAQPTQAKVRSGIPVTFGYRPPFAKGPINDEITIKTNGIDGGLLRLKVAGYVSESAGVSDAVVVTPAGFSVSGKDSRPLSFAVKNDSAATVTIEGVDSSFDFKGADKAVSDIKPGETGSITLEPDPAGITPGTKGYVYIRLGLPVEAR